MRHLMYAARWPSHPLCKHSDGRHVECAQQSSNLEFELTEKRTRVVRPVHRAAPDAAPPAAIAARRALSSFWQSFLCAPQSSA